MSLGPTVLLLHAVMMILGGIMGFRAGSKVSLYAGGASGLLLLVAWGVTRVHPTAGLWMGALIALLLTVTFGRRLAKTGKLMPAGMLLAVSAFSFLLLTYSAVTG